MEVLADTSWPVGDLFLKIPSSHKVLGRPPKELPERPETARALGGKKRGAHAFPKARAAWLTSVPLSQISPGEKPRTSRELSLALALSLSLSLSLLHA